MKQIVFTFFLLMSFVANLHAQQPGYWQALEPTEVPFELERTISTRAAQHAALDFEAMKQLLRSAPAEFSPIGLEVPLLMPDGSIMTAEVWETPQGRRIKIG